MVLPKKPENVHWLTGQFRDNQKERLYRESIQTQVRFDTCLALILAASLFGMFAITDYFLLGLTREYYLLVAMRITVVSLTVILAFFIARWGSYSERPWLHALPLWILAIGIILIVPLRPESLGSQVTAVAVATTAFYLLIPNLLTVATLASLFLCIGFLVAAVEFAGVTGAVTLRIGLLLVMANLVGFSALLRLENLQRKQFALLREEREQNDHLVTEIARRKSLEAQLRQLAEKDALTGLNNRSYFMQRAGTLLKRAATEKIPFSLFMVDVDHFKKINDTLGHTHGDRVLKQIAESLAESLRPTDVIGRFGGEEFVVALPDTAANDAQHLAERLRESIATLALQDEMGELTLSITVGIAVAQDGETDLEALIKRADDLLYTGKRDGRNRVVLSA
ncbi:GGDEF domain-containing protein [Pseudidiomarina aestuarii]|uniref:GGDEF domain-containing protein n=1 Tax=Pseudidiomarina aestuarii TaxID=624146 RepID=UPI003A96BC9D